MTILLGILNLVLTALYVFIAFQFQAAGNRLDTIIGNTLMIVPVILAVASFFVPGSWRLIITGILLGPLLALGMWIFWSWKLR